MEAKLTHETFAPLLHDKFSVEVSDTQQVELELETISELKVSERQEQFAVEFRGPSDAFLGQGMRRFTHAQMGQFVLFLVPVGQDASGFRYESVFNRMRNRSEENVAPAPS